MTTVSIVGSAGRGADAKKMNPALWDRMVENALSQIYIGWQLGPGVELLKRHEDIVIVSGGAAFADHVAISVHLQEPDTELRLWIPCEWDTEGACFADDGTRNWRKNPGGTANYYHRQFAKAMGLERNHTLKTLDKLRDCMSVKHGFKPRNTEVAKSDYLIAFTWGESDVPKDGGTKDTWDKATDATKIHFPLGAL